MRKTLLARFSWMLLSCSAISAVNAQEKWDLKRCVDFALANNISVKQTDVQARISNLTFKQSKASQLPTANLSVAGNVRRGLTENPTTGIFEDQSFFNNSYQFQTQVGLFNFFSLRNTIAGNELDVKAANAQTDKIRNDIALNVAAAYLQVLLNRETARVSEVQVKQSRASLDNTQKLVAAGTLPELNAAELEAQLSRDSSNFINSQANAELSLLQLKALLNLDAASAFDIDNPPVNLIPVEPIAELAPEAVYSLALQNLPQQKVNDLRLQAADKYIQAARGRMYPSIAAFGSLNTNYVNLTRPDIQATGNFRPNGSIVQAGPSTFPVLSPEFKQVGEIGTPWGNQLKNNFGQNIGIGLQVPLFNQLQNKTQYRRALLNKENLQLQKEQDIQTLKQDIYRAYQNAVAALQKFQANERVVKTAERTYAFSQKRYDAGLLRTIDLITNQNNFFRAEVERLAAQYDYVFKLKVLEFYRGQGIKLQ